MPLLLLLILAANLPAASAIVAKHPKRSAADHADDAKPPETMDQPVALAQESSNASFDFGEDEEAAGFALGDQTNLGLEAYEAKRRAGMNLMVHNKMMWKKYAADQLWKKEEMAKALAWQSASNAKAMRNAAFFEGPRNEENG